MTYTVNGVSNNMRGCNVCGEGPDEDGCASCDCHKPRIMCEACNELVREDAALLFYKYTHEEIIHCEDCLDYLSEQDEEWWFAVAEEYFLIHETIRENLNS